MTGTIKKMLQSLEGEITRNFKPRVPEPGESEEERDTLDEMYEVDFYSVQSFKLGFFLGFELAKGE